MDAVTIAANLVHHQAALQKLDVSVKLVKQQADSKQGLIDLITATAEGSATYAPSGKVPSPSAGSILNQRG